MAPILMDSFTFRHNVTEQHKTYHLPKAGALLFCQKMYHYDNPRFDPIKFMETNAIKKVEASAIQPNAARIPLSCLTAIDKMHTKGRTVLRTFHINHFVFVIKKTSHLTREMIYALPSQLQAAHFNLTMQVIEIITTPLPGNEASEHRIHVHGFVGLTLKVGFYKPVRTIQMFMRRVVFRMRCLRRALLLAACMGDHPRLGENASSSYRALLHDPWGNIMRDVIAPQVLKK